LNALLGRLWPAPAHGNPPLPLPFREPRESRLAAEAVPVSPSLATPAQTLGVLRDFSGILTHSLNAEAMLNQFLLLLRDILSINRGAIFLRQPVSSFGGSPQLEEGRRLRAACSVGLS